MLHIQAAIAMIATALPGMAFACGTPAGQGAPNDRPAAITQPVGTLLGAAPPTGVSRCGSWQAAMMAHADAAARRTPRTATRR